MTLAPWGTCCILRYDDLSPYVYFLSGTPSSLLCTLCVTFTFCHTDRHDPLRTTMYDSDTESEPENDLKKWDAAEFASQLPHAISEGSDGDLMERVTDAIDTLGSIPAEEVLMVPITRSSP
jgi:hypothetical protein